MNVSPDATLATKWPAPQEGVPYQLGKARAPLRSYSLSTSLWLISTLLFVVLATSQLVPPLQSPDEAAHISRAYLMSRGKIFLEASNGVTGGFVDTGLIDYFRLFSVLPAQYHNKVTNQMLRNAREISFTKEERFLPLANTALYFPLIYTPQALAFTLGRLLSLGVNDTYYLARTLSLGSVLALLWAALRIYPLPLPILSLFAMPMVVFQLGATSLDGVSFAIAILAGAIYARAIERPLLHSPVLHATLAFSLMLLAVSRTHLIGMVWTPLALHLVQRKRMYAYWTYVSISLSTLWIAYIAVTVRGNQAQDTTPVEIVLYYLSRPLEIYSVTISTLSNGPLLSHYWRMFIGILGWLDTPLDPRAYVFLSIAFVSLIVLSFKTSREAIICRPCLALLAGAALSTLLLFVFSLLTFTLHPAKVVGGIQGRYFYHVAIFMLFALLRRPMSLVGRKVGFGILFLMMTVSIVSTVPKLLERYSVSL